MTISSLIEESIENPPVDQGPASVEGGAVTSPLAKARYQAYVNLSDTGREDNDTPGLIFNIDAVNSYHANLKEKRLVDDQLSMRREEARALEAQILGSDMTPEATYATLRDLRESMDQGVAPEDLAVQELSARNIALAEDANQEAIAYDQAIENEEKYDIQRQLAEVRQSIEIDFAPTIPGVEDVYEFLVSAIMAPRSGGTNVAGLLETMFPVDAFQLAPGDTIPEAMALVAKMTPEEKSNAIKKGHDYINRKAGILFDNEEDAMIMMNALEAVFGNRVQAEASRTSAKVGQIVDTVLTIATSGVIGASVKAVKRLKKGTSSATTSVVDNAVDGSTAPFIQQADNAAVEGAEGVVLGPKATKALRGSNRDAGVSTGKGISTSVPHTGMPAFSPAQTLNDVAPKIAGPILSDAVTDVTGKVAKGLGATRAQIVDDLIVPNVADTPIRRGATLIMGNIANQLSDAGANLRNLMHDSRLYTAKELEQVEKNLGSTLDNLVNKDEVVLINKSEAFIDEKTGRVSMTYVIGAGGDNTFATAADARDFIKRLPTSRLDDIEVLRYSPAKGSYQVHDRAEDELGDYVLRAKYTHSAASGAKKENVLRNAEANFLTNNVATSVSYIDRISKSISRLDIRQAQAAKVFKKVLQPLNNLSSKEDLDSVWDALKKAEKNPEDFTNGQLNRMFEGNVARTEAYQAVRRFYQAVYEIRNQMYRAYLSKQGFLSHMHGDGTPAWVRPTRNTNDINTVWWDEAGTIVSKEALEAKGIELDYLQAFKPRRVEGKEGVIMETSYVAVRKGKTALKPLPAQVLHNKKTYLGRHLEAKYVVEEFDNVIVNGNAAKIGRVIAVANNPLDAAKEAAKSATAKPRRAIETSKSDASYISQELDQMHDLQMLTNTKHRMDFEQMDVTRQESIISPMESLDRVANTMSKHVALDEWVEYITNKWVATYGNLIRQDGFPWGGEISLKKGLENDPIAKARLAKAEKVRERIQLTSGKHDIQVGEKFQEAMLGTGEWLSRAAANSGKKSDANLLRKMQSWSTSKVATGTTWMAGYNPVSKAKALAHFSFITANPIRQFLMNSTSATMYAGVEHGAKYMATGRAGVDLIFLIMAKTYKDVDVDSFNKIVGQYAKLSDTSLADAHKFFDDFDNSGTLGSVTSHQFLEHGFRAGGTYRNHAGTYAAEKAPDLMSKAAHSGAGGVKAAVRMSSKYGFEASEKMNRMVAYGAVRNKHLQNGTLSGMTPTDLGTEGIRMAGDMGQYSKAAFQDGAWGLPFQFMSHTTRMIQYMMPHTKWTSWIASDVLSNQEKAKVAVWQAVLFGGSGVGLGSLFSDSAATVGIEPNALVQEALEEGLGGLALESMIEGLAGSDANLNFSKTVAPLSGLTGDIQQVLRNGARAATPLGQAYRIVMDMATSVPVGYDDLTGASSGAAGNLKGIASNVIRLWSNPVLGYGEKLELQARHIAVMLPGVNNILQARIIANTGEYMSKYGTPIAQATVAEALSKGLFGVEGEQKAHAYDLNAELRGRRTTVEAPSHKELSTSGRDMANFTFNALRQLSSGTMSKEEIMDRIEAGNAAVHMAYENQTDRDIVRASMRKELIRLVGDKETLADELVNILASDLEVSHKMGWDKVIENVEKLGPSEYGDYVISNINRIRANEQGSKLTFEAEQ